MRLLGPSLGILCVVAAGIGAVGCGGYGSYCQDMMDCLGGNDADVDACKIGEEANEDVADNDNCSDEWSAYSDCRDEEARCVGHEWTDNGHCDSKRDRWHDCIK